MANSWGVFSGMGCMRRGRSWSERREDEGRTVEGAFFSWAAYSSAIELIITIRLFFYSFFLLFFLSFYISFLLPYS